ncbi:hypothetical protein DAD186_13330 [Dermabacter vaginalis]|uniref:Uncharacterized protein n=1 Tax=Dermabacter vaginalis TaxID=1630135 RepID=A0A1B0ZIX9_9MICO|nr:hypothetical protein DAD186_13330 [Dermabacter vaginalis]
MRRPLALGWPEYGTFWLECTRTPWLLAHRTRRGSPTIHTHVRTSFAASQSITRARRRAPRLDNTEPPSNARHKHGKQRKSGTMLP